MFPLELERCHRLCLGPLPHQTPGFLADEHFARPGGLLEPGGYVHGITDHVLGSAAHEYFAGVDPDAHRQFDAPTFGQLWIELGEVSLHVEGGPHRPQGVILPCHGHAEKGDHGVADELLHRPAVALEGHSHRSEVTLQERPQALGIGALSQTGRPHQVTEQGRDCLADVVRALTGQLGAALRAEFRLLPDRRPTPSTDHRHLRNATPPPGYSTWRA